MLINDPTKKDYLLSEDVVIRIGEEDIQLEPFNYLTDVRSAEKAFTQALDLAVEHDEFDFLPHIIKSFASADFGITHHRWHSFDANGRNQLYHAIRLALNNGHSNLVIRLLGRGDEVGVQINSVLLRLVATALRNEVHVVDQLRLATQHIPEAATQEKVKQVVLDVARGVKRPDEQKSVEYLQVRLEALRNGFQTAMRLNRLVARNAHDHKSAVNNKLVNDPLLLALPLEFKAGIERTEEALSKLGASTSASSPQPEDSTAPAADAEAEAEADSSEASAQPTSPLSTTLPTNAPSSSYLTTTLVNLVLSEKGSTLKLTPEPDYLPPDFDYSTQSGMKTKVALFRLIQLQAEHERLTIISEALETASNVPEVQGNAALAAKVQKVKSKVDQETQELLSGREEIEQVQDYVKKLGNGYFGNQFQGEKGLKLTLHESRLRSIEESA